MKKNSYFRSFLILIAISLALITSTLSVQATVKAESLAEKISALELGMDGYIIGSRLSPEKKEYAADHLLDVSYPGTYKFNDNGLLVVVAEKDDTVLALYKRQEETGIEQARSMISGLMGLFGEPTTMAHDQLIYWAYNGEGKIPEEKYMKLREKGERVSVLATVKFNSTHTITAETPDAGQAGTSYFIITSDPLLQGFIRE